MVGRMALALTLCLLLAAAGRSAAEVRVESSESILVQVLGSKYTVLVKLLEMADLLGDLEADESFADGVTIFAPTDLYLTEKVSPSLLAFLEQPRNDKLLRQVLLNHIVKGKLNAGAWYPGRVVKTIAGGEADLHLEGGDLKVNNAVVREIGVLEAEDGVVHSINGFLVPAEVEESAQTYIKELMQSSSERREVLQIESNAVLAPAPAPSSAFTLAELLKKLSDNGFTLLVAQLEKNTEITDFLTALLAANSEFTLFAPTDDAFTAAAPLLGALDSSVITSVLFYHLVNGTYYYADLVQGDSPPTSRRLLQTGITLPTFENETVNVVTNRTSGIVEVFVNTAKISKPDVLGSELSVSALGIDGLLIPPSVVLPSPPPPPPVLSSVVSSPPPSSPPPSAGVKSGSSMALFVASLAFGAVMIL